MNCNEDNLSFKLEKFPNNGGQNETKNKNKILRKTGHCRIIYKNISNVTILSSSSQSVPNILECSITKQHVSRFTLCRPFFSLRIKQYIYIYISRKYLLETWHGAKEKYSLPLSLSPPLLLTVLWSARHTQEWKGKESGGGTAETSARWRSLGESVWWRGKYVPATATYVSAHSSPVGPLMMIYG